MKIFNKAFTFLKEVKTEMKKVNWPNREETLQYTILVIVVTASVAAFLGLSDFLFSTLLQRLIL
ncbi:MAG: preprotein translocase subunit SecE [Minisyncoccales bacterium]